LDFLLNVGLRVRRGTMNSLNILSMGLLTGQDETAEDGLALRRADAAGETAR
jgi:hypothetical protein